MRRQPANKEPPPQQNKKSCQKGATWQKEHVNSTPAGGGGFGDGKEDAMKRLQGGQTQGLVSFPGEICCQGKGGLPLPLENRVPGHGWCLSVGCPNMNSQGAVFPEANSSPPSLARAPTLR